MDLSLEKLKEAVSIREQIEALQDRLSGIFGGGSSRSTAASTSATTSSTTSMTGTGNGRRGARGGRRRTMSAATRAKLAAAAKARWARRDGTIGNKAAARAVTVKSSKGSAKASPAGRSGGAKRGKLSAAGRKAISDAMKKRWAAHRAGKR